jgi:hypothetical protein
VAWRYSLANEFLRGSSPIRAALRCFSSRTRSEDPHRSAECARLCATCLIADAQEHKPLGDVAAIAETLHGVRPKAHVPSGSQTPKNGCLR